MRYLQILAAVAAILFSAHSSAMCGVPPTLTCDADGNGDVNIDDINAISDANGTSASGPGDVRDIDGDGMITLLDARQ